MADTGDRVTRKYKNFRGVDFRGEECSLNRSPDSLNVWRNYKNLASIETRPALEHIYTHHEGMIRNMKWHNGKLYFIAQDGFLHALNKDGTVEWEIILVHFSSCLFEFNGKLYAMGQTGIFNVTDRCEVEPFIPTTTIGRKPSGGGTVYQDVNMLTSRRINTFLADGTSKTYHLDTKDITSEQIIVKVNGEVVSGAKYAISYAEGRILFQEAPPAPLTDGQDNVSIEFGTKSNNRFKILGCSIVQEFDNRIFVSGNSNYPSTIWHCSLNDVSYFSDLDYYVDGVDQAPIRSMVSGNNGLWVFRDSTVNSVFYHQPALDDEYGKVYPSSHSSIALGCVGRAINFNDDIVFFSERGMEGASTDVTTEQFVTHRSSLVDRKMLAHSRYKFMILAEWEGYLLVFMGGDVYLADSRAVLTNENHIEYEWYHWKLGDYQVNCVEVHDGVLYIGAYKSSTEGHIYSFTREAKNGDEHVNTTTPIKSYWTTPKDVFGAPNMLKTTNKKGCVVEATGDVAVSVKTDKDDAYELIGTNEGIADYFVSRIKRKKFKDIQMKFESETSFSLEAASLECFVGGYIKR